MHPITKTMITTLAVPTVLAGSYLLGFAVIGEHLDDLAVVALALTCGLLAPGLFALWFETGWRGGLEGVAIGLGLAVIGSALGIALAVPAAISAGGLGGMVLGIRWARRYRPASP